MNHRREPSPPWEVLLMIGICMLPGIASIARADWEQSNFLVAEDGSPKDYFARSLATNADFVVVGAYGDGPPDFAGSVYVYDVITGVQQRKLTADDASYGAQFGRAVAVNEETVLVGAPYADAVYVFDLMSGDQLRKITPAYGNRNIQFGYAIAGEGDIALIGAFSDDEGGLDSGAAYVFNIVTGEQIHKLMPDDPRPMDLFGRHVDLKGSIAIIGAQGDDDGGEDVGSAYLFDVTTGEQLHKLTADDPVEESEFGSAVAIHESMALVGAPYENNNLGYVYLFDITTGKQIKKFTGSGCGAGDWFGSSAAISGDLALIGAPGWSYDHGIAYLYDISDPQYPAFVEWFWWPSSVISHEFGESVALNQGVAVVGTANGLDHTGFACLFETCAADVYGDGIVDVTDLLDVLSAWGSDDVYADVNGDDIVDVLDLLMVLGDWGPCE